MRIRRSAAIAATLVLAVIPAAVGGAAAGGGGTAGPGSGAAAQAARHRATVAHWTEARMRAAIPRDLSLAPARGASPVPQAKPGGGGTGGNTTGASWPNGRGDVYKRTGKVYFEMGGGGYVCSGTALDDTRGGYSLVITAAHCVYDESSGGGLSGFATNWLFIPQFDSHPTFTCGSTAYGCWTASSLVVHDGYASAGGFNNTAVRYDWGFAVVGLGGKGSTPDIHLDATVGTYGYGATEMDLNTVVDAFGYPAAGKYRGKDLVYCQGPTTRDSNPGTNNYKLACGMTGGSSGGPWIEGLDVATGNGGTIRSVNSYGYSGQSFMYGPIFNAGTTQTYNAANAATTTNVIVR